MRYTSLIGLVLVISSSYSSSPVAADQKRMAANACLLEYDSDNSFYDRGGARIGTRDTTQNFVCPLVRSNTTNTNGLTSLKLNLFKQVSTQFTCFAESYDQNGSPIKIVARSTTQTGLTSLSWGSSLNSGSAKGAYGLSCEVVGAVGSAFWGDELYSIDYTEP